MLLGHDHGEDMTEVVLPNVLLATAFASALFSSIALGNHTKLSEGKSDLFGLFPARVPKLIRSVALLKAVGNRFLTSQSAGSRRRQSNPVALILSRSYGLFGNPFSLMVLACTGTLLFGGLTVSP